MMLLRADLQMDSRIVGREIRNEIWPLLRKNGFNHFRLKTAWRYLPEQIHIVNFQSFNSYLAEGIGCTTFSFALKLGIYLKAIPVNHPVRNRPDPAVTPQVWDCHLQHHLSKKIEQRVLPRRDVWYVERDGSNLLECMADARAILEQDGLPWFARFASPHDVLALLMSDDWVPELHAGPQSPARKYMIGHMALRLGQSEVAERMIAEANRELEAITTKIKSFGRKRK